MKCRAIVSFTGTISMAMGEVREISDLAIAKNLIKVGYVEEIKDKNETVTEKKTKSPRRKGNKDGN